MLSFSLLVYEIYEIHNPNIYSEIILTECYKTEFFLGIYRDVDYNNYLRYLINFSPIISVKLYFFFQ